MHFRIGVHLGDVAEKADRSVYGDGVNVAARLQALAPSGSVVVSEAVWLAAKGTLADVFEDFGEQRVKNIDDPVRTLCWRPEASRNASPGATATAEARRSSGGHRFRHAPGNLPVRIAPLYGRADDVERVGQLLLEHRLVSAIGPGGIGKTRVAQAVAHAATGNHADGVWLVELAPLSDPQLVAPTVARTLGLTLSMTEGSVDALQKLIEDKSLLLVLDNCEHLLDAVARLVRQIIAGCPGVQVLVTSQEPLHVAQEQIVRLGPLAVPAMADATTAVGYGAVELFVARAKGADPRFGLTSDNVADVVETCRRLDGIPLAVELAAARVSLLGVAGVRRRLDERLNLLATGDRTALPRHQALRAALQWSYSLLSAPEQLVFDRLGVFAGSFCLEAAQLVASDDAIDTWAVLDHLASLADKSLVMVEAGEPPRYRLLETSRAFALERIAAGGSREALLRRHAVAIAETLTGPDPFEGPNARMDRIAPDLDNVRGATNWALGPSGDRQVAIALAAATDMLWDDQGCNDEGARLYQAVEPWVADDATPPRLASRFWFAVSNQRLWTDLRHQAEAGLRAADLFLAMGDRFHHFRALQSAALKLGWLRDRVGAQRAYEEMAKLLAPSWPSWVRGSLEYGLGSCAYFAEDDPEKALVLITNVIELHRRTGGDAYFADSSELLLAPIYLALGQYEATLRLCNRVLDGSHGLRRRGRERAIVLGFCGAALTRLDRLEEAEAAMRSAIPQIIHSVGSAPWAFCFCACLCARRRRPRDAMRLLGYVDGLLSGRALSLNARTFHDEALTAAAPALQADELDRLRTEGRGMSADEAVAVAFPARA